MRSFVSSRWFPPCLFWRMAPARGAAIHPLCRAERSRGCGGCKPALLRPAQPLVDPKRFDAAAPGGAHPTARLVGPPMSPSNPSHDKRLGPRTRLVHAGRDPAEQHGFVNTPIYRGSTVLYPTMDDLLHRRGRYSYGTKGTPTIEALEAAWTAFAGAAGAALPPPRRTALPGGLLFCLQAGRPPLVAGPAHPAPPHLFRPGAGGPGVR